jgi:hypothetical protein
VAADGSRSPYSEMLELGEDIDNSPSSQFDVPMHLLQ